MKLLRLTVDPTSPEVAVGKILCADLPAPERGLLFHKGHVFEPADLPKLLLANGRELHLLQLEPGDVHEDEAARRLAQAVAGPGIDLQGPVQSRFNLVATVRGLLKVDVEALAQLNLVENVTVFALFDNQVVSPGEVVAATKVTPLAIREELLQQAEAMCRAHSPIVRILPFQRSRVGVIVREEMSARDYEKFRANVVKKLAWYGSELIEALRTPAEEGAIVGTISGFVEQHANLIVIGGTNSTDPVDPTFGALHRLGARLVRQGVPAHPGSTYWFYSYQAVLIFGLASCGMFSEATSADLILPRLLAGERVTRAMLASLGHGGLLNRSMSFRFPKYDD